MLEMQQACDEAVVQAAKQICMAAVTAPKACGRDTVTCGVLTGDEVRRLAEEMVRMEREVPNCKPIFVRDAELVSQCPAVVLLGCRGQSRGLTPCGLCGHENCGACHAAGGHCAFDDMDLGIAIGSACAMAAGSGQRLKSSGVTLLTLASVVWALSATQITHWNASSKCRAHSASG